MKQTVVVLGSEGMLGHQVLKVFKEHPGYTTIGISGALPATLRWIMPTSPGVVINCIGMVPQNGQFNDIDKVYATNALLPHRLQAECQECGVRLIHISTDCVFSGDAGEDYTEKHVPDPTDVYGKSKLLGEIDARNALTIRTSLIGPEPRHKRGLLEWFLAQHGEVPGYANAFFSGLTTLELAKVLRDHIVPNTPLQGLFHVGGPSISKFELLKCIEEEYGPNVAIEPVAEPRINRSLNSHRFRVCTGYQSPTWEQMIREMRSAN